MKKILIILAALVLIILTISPAMNSLAFSPIGTVCSSGGASVKASVCSNTSGKNPIYGPGGVLDKIINLIAVIVGIAAVFAIIVAGFQYIISGGDSAKINTAKNTIIFAIVGLIVVALARLIEAFVVNSIK